MRQRGRRIDDDGSETLIRISNKNNKEKKMWNVDNKVKIRKLSTPSCEKEKKKEMLSSNNDEKKMQSGDRCKDKRSNTPLSLNKNKIKKNENKKRTAPITCPVKKKKMRPSDSMETKMHNCDNKDKKKRNTPSVLPKENKIQTVSNNKKENKRKESPTPFKKEKKMRVDDNDKKVGSDDKGKGNKMQGDTTKEKKVQRGDREKKRKAPPAFFKFICNNFKEFLLIPPTIAPKLEDWTNHFVYLKDSEGKSSKIRLSVMDGSLAFHHGWGGFVSDHSIKWGDFLLFEYAGISTFSVRVFGMDCCERLHFDVERQGRNNQKESHTSLDDLVSSQRGRNSEDIDDRHYVSGEYPRSKEPKATVGGYSINNGKIASCNLVAESMNAASETHRMTANKKEDPSRVVSGVERGPSAAVYNEEGNLATGERKTKSISPMCSKEKTRRSEIILTTDAAPLTQENNDTVKLTLFNAASETHHVTVNTKEDPQGVAGESWCGPSVSLDNEGGNLAIGECKTKSISPMCSKEKTRRSEIILITDAVPLTQENDDTVKLTTFSHHKENRSMMRESEPEVATPTKCTEIHDSDEDLRRKERNTVQLECTTVVDNCPNNSKMNTTGNVCRKYGAPGGSRCLEKWKKGIVSGRAALDGTGLIRPEKPQKTDEKLVGSCGAMGLNPVEHRLWSDSTDSCVQPVPDRISKSGHSRAEFDHSVNGKGATVQLQTKKETIGTCGKHCK